MKTYIIGEAGANYNQGLKKAKSMLNVAVRAGCDIRKFKPTRMYL